MTELRTDRLVLRRACPDDLFGLHAVLSDERAMQYWSSGPHNDVEESRAWLQSMIDADPNESDDFIVTASGAVIGKLGCWRLPEIGFILRSDYWGNGLGSEAMRAFLLHVFAAREISRVTADVDPRNEASLKLLRSHGFVETARAKGTWNTHIGLCDSVYLSLDRETAKRNFSAG